MRELTRFDAANDAQTLADALVASDIECEVKEGGDGAHVVWVIDEEDLEAARAVARAYEDDPQDARFHEARNVAREKRAHLEAEERKSRHAQVDMRKRFQASTGIGRLTAVLIAISVGVALVSELGGKESVVRMLTIASFESDGAYIRWFGLDDLAGGEVWRLVTPIFLHFGILHIVFNMLWLKDLGTLIEHKQSTAFLAGLVVATAIIPNLAQYYIGGSPLFGGMSGVVFGLLGYVWVRSRKDPGSGYDLPQPLVVWMLAWLVLGFTGLVGPIANYAHLGGLAVGAAVGVVASARASR